MMNRSLILFVLVVLAAVASTAALFLPDFVKGQ
jgi:hypothetical protein